MKTVAIMLLAVFSGSASAYERCYLEPKAKGNSSCTIASYNQIYLCVGPTKNDYISCTTSSGEPIECILKEGKFREPKEVWCDSPAIPLSDAPVFTIVQAPPRRLVAERNSTKAASSAVKGSVSAEDCEAIIKVGEDSWDYQRQYNMKVRCLKRKTAIEGQIPYENCNALVTGVPGSWDELFQQKRRQNCLDRQAGIEVPPNKTLICTQTPGLPGQSSCR